MSVMEVLPSSSSSENGDANPLSERAADSEPAAAAAETSSEKCAVLKAKGNALFGEGKVEDALEVYREALTYAVIKPLPETPEAPPPTTAAAQDGESTSVEEAPENASPSNDGGDAKNENVVDAETTAQYILTSQLYCNAGLCLKKLEEVDEAIECLTEAIRHQPDYQKAFLRRADCYYDKQKWSNCYADYESYEKLSGVLTPEDKKKRDYAKTKVDEEMKKMLSDLKDLGNRFLGNFGLSTDNFKFEKDPNTGGYSMRFEK